MVFGLPIAMMEQLGDPLMVGERGCLVVPWGSKVSCWTLSTTGVRLFIGGACHLGLTTTHLAFAVFEEVRTNFGKAFRLEEENARRL